MKRFIFSVCALAAVVVGCTKSEVINRPHAEEPIQFNPYLGRIPVTKGSIANETVLGTSGFQVYAYMHAPATTNENGSVDYGEDNSSIEHDKVTPYMNKVVTWDSAANEGKGGWVYDGHAYWPATNQLDFIAYGLNCGEDFISEESETDHTKINFTVDTDVKAHQDLLVAKALMNKSFKEAEEGQPDNSADVTVNFVFSHLLSRIGFSLITKTDNPTVVTLKQVDLVGNFYGTGKVNLLAVDNLKVDPTGNAEETTYKLLGEDGTFSDKANASGVEVFDNSMLYEFVDKDGYNDDEYKAKDFKDDQEVVDQTAKDAATAQANANKDNRYMMIIPIKAEDHDAKIVVTYCLPGAKTFDPVEIPLSGIDFEAGKAYEFKFKVSTNSISFDVDVTEWVSAGEEDDTIHKLN